MRLIKKKGERKYTLQKSNIGIWSDVKKSDGTLYKYESINKAKKYHQAITKVIDENAS